MPELVWLYRDSAAELGMRSSQGAAEDALLRGACGGEPATDDLAAALCPGWVSARGPSSRQMRAAEQQRQIHAALAALPTRHQAAIAVAYEARDVAGVAGGPALSARYGIAAGLVLRAQREQARREALVFAVVQRAAVELARVRAQCGALEVEHARHDYATAVQVRAALRAGSASLAALAVAALVDAHDAYSAARREQRAGAAADRQALRARAQARREALLCALTQPSARSMARAVTTLLREIEAAQAAE